MPIITRTGGSVEPQDWRQLLASSIRTTEELLSYLHLSDELLTEGAASAVAEFPLLVPKGYADQMEKGNPDDPLLLQVLPLGAEVAAQPGYVRDPLGEKHSNVEQGVIHKYKGRVLLLAASGCAVNCRYCFRRHFPYQDNRVGRQQWQTTLKYVAANESIEEVILSGGDPLMLQDAQFAELVRNIEEIPHVTRLRVHTRLPVVIPQRITPEFIECLRNSRLQVSCVLHVNHANELSAMHREYLNSMRVAGITLLNQAVLLKNVNNDLGILSDLSKQLFEFGVLPYYLHLLDAVQGASHFDIDEREALELHGKLLEELPGYLVPKLVREEAGKKSKTPVVV